jgi:hypothetical protein
MYIPSFGHGIESCASLHLMGSPVYVKEVEGMHADNEMRARRAARRALAALAGPHLPDAVVATAAAIVAERALAALEQSLLTDVGSLLQECRAMCHTV